MTKFVRDKYELYRAWEQTRTPYEPHETEIRCVVDNLEQVDFKLGRNGIVKLITPNVEQMLGYRQCDLAGRHFLKLMPERLQDEATRLFKEVLSGKNLRFEITTISAAGDRRWVGGYIRPLMGSNRITGAHGTFADITDRKQEERALRESERRYSSMVEKARDGFVVVQGKSCLYLNKGMTRITGYTLEDLAGSDLLDLLTPDSQKQILDRYNLSLIGQDTDTPYEFAVHCKDGTMKSIEAVLAQTSFEGRPAMIATVRDITRRLKEEEALRKSDALLRLLAENVEDGMWTTDLDLNLTFYGPSAARLASYSPEEEFSRKLNDRMSPETLDQARAMVSQQLAIDGQPGVDPHRSWTMELETCSSNGEMVWVEAKTTFIREAGGNPTGLLGVTRNITARKQAEIRLRESELMYATLIEQANDGIAIVQDGLYVFVNPAMESITGYPASELLGKCFLDLVSPERRDFLASRYDLWMTGDHASRENDMRLVRKDGQVREVEVAAKAITYRDKPAIMGFMRDITSRRRVEAALWRSQERLRLIFESVADGITVTDLECRVLDVNQKALEIYGVNDKESIYGKPAFEYIAPGDLPIAMQALPQTLSEGRASYTEYTLRRQDGTEFPAELNVSVLTDVSDTPTGFVVLTRDITERKRAEQALQQAYAQEFKLRQDLEEEINKRGEFLRGLVHELKSPLTSMMVSSELLSDSVEMPHLVIARNLRRGTHNLNRRIDELMDLARGEMGILNLDLRAIHPRLLLKSVYDDFAALAAERSITLKYEMPASLSAIWADADRLRQVLQNLMGNAIKFVADEGYITLRARQDSNSLIVEVEDTGPGIPPEQQARLFDPYYRPQGVRGRKSGLGLGLALCKTLVELHGGTIWVDSTVEKGTTFGFDIPRKLPQGSKAST